MSIEQKLKLFLSCDIKHGSKRDINFDILEYKDNLSQNDDEDFEVLSFIWNSFGLASFKDGLFWTIGPKEYMTHVRRFEGVSSQAIPIIRTAMGSFIVWDFIDEEWVIMYLNTQYNEYTFLGDLIADLFYLELMSDAYWENNLNGEREKSALETYPNITYEECIAFSPVVITDGVLESTSLIRVKMLEYLA